MIYFPAAFHTNWTYVYRVKTLPLLGFILLISTPGLAQVSVVTQHNNLSRNGWNAHEKILTTKNVSKTTFGLVFTRIIDDQIYAQPLVVGKVSINNTTRNVVYVATVNNTLYAFDADSVSLSTPYWSRNLTPTGSRAIKNTDMTGACGGNYYDFSGNMGIVGTPVIDTVSQTIYLVARDVSNNVFHQYLHAIDIRTGAEKSGSPVLIIAQTSGTGDGGSVVNFDPQKNNQRPGLMLLNGIVYIAWSSHCDWGPYHGWLIGYDATTLQQKIVYCDTPNGYEAGIWMSGAGPSADQFGNIYLVTGNGSVGTDSLRSDPVNRGESALKLTLNGSTLSVASFFTPSDFQYLEDNDLDFGVTAALLIPNSTWAVAGSKNGYIYLMDRDSMGGYDSTANNVQQTIDLGRSSYSRAGLAYYMGSVKEFLYFWSENHPLTAFPFSRLSNLFDLPNSTTSSDIGPEGANGALLSVSSNGSNDSTAILWASHAVSCNANQSVCPGIVRAIQATDVTKELWNSSMNPGDNPGTYAKFVCPTIANGKVYMATFSKKLVVYGLLKKQVTTEVGSTSNDIYPNVYPNPAPNYVIIGQGRDAIIDITVYDLSGRVVKTAVNPDGLTKVDVALSDLTRGLYILQVRTTSATYRYKIIH